MSGGSKLGWWFTALVLTVLVLLALTSRAGAAPAAVQEPTSTPVLDPLLAAEDTPYAWPFEVPWRVDCTDDNPYNGYSKGDGQDPEVFYCVPGRVPRSMQWSTGPATYEAGVSMYSSEEALRAQCRRQAENRRMNCEDYNGRFAATMFCGNIGRRLWVNDQGPFLVVDCSSDEDLPVNVLVKELGVEISPAWRDRLGGWGSIRVEYGEPWKRGAPLSEWFLENVTFEYQPEVTSYDLPQWHDGLLLPEDRTNLGPIVPALETPLVVVLTAQHDPTKLTLAPWASPADVAYALAHPERYNAP